MRISYCTLGFHRFNTSNLTLIANLVKNGIYSNPIVFVTPPIAEVDFEKSINVFVQKAADYDQYGITKKTAYLLAKEGLMESLDTTANYVNSVALGDVSIIALSGFDASREVAQKSLPLEKIDNFTAKRSDASGEIIVTIPAIVGYGVINYGCVCAEGAPLTSFNVVNGQFKINPSDPMVYQDLNKSRRKVFSGLQPGVVYYFYAFAVNASSVSPVSDNRQVMAA